MTRLVQSLKALLVVLAIVPFFARAQAPQAASERPDTGSIKGVVFVIDFDGTRSVMAGAHVQLEGSPRLVETVTDQQGNFSLTAVAPATYHIRAKAPGLGGSATVTVTAAAVVETSIEL